MSTGVHSCPLMSHSRLPSRQTRKTHVIMAPMRTTCTHALARSAGFQTCCIADFPSARLTEAITHCVRKMGWGAPSKPHRLRDHHNPTLNPPPPRGNRNPAARSKIGELADLLPTRPRRTNDLRKSKSAMRRFFWAGNHPFFISDSDPNP